MWNFSVLRVFTKIRSHRRAGIQLCVMNIRRRLLLQTLSFEWASEFFSGIGSYPEWPTRPLKRSFRALRSHDPRTSELAID